MYININWNYIPLWGRWFQNDGEGEWKTHHHVVVGRREGKNLSTPLHNYWTQLSDVSQGVFLFGQLPPELFRFYQVVLLLIDKPPATLPIDWLYHFPTPGDVFHYCTYFWKIKNNSIKIIISTCNTYKHTQKYKTKNYKQDLKA